MSEAEILFEVAGRAGVITLNRPHAFNALTLDMIGQMQAKLEQWAVDDAISHVLIEAAPGKAFCAGGDIRVMYDWGRKGDPRAGQFFREEYKLNNSVKNFPKPYIALMDGITMGGGVGVSLHGDVRIATENFVFAMPETGIGLYPDVGATYFLPRCPGKIGLYLGLTGARLKASDAFYAGLIDFYVPSEKMADLKAALLVSEDLRKTVQSFAEDPGPPSLPEISERIDEIFYALSLEDIFTKLKQNTSEWASETLKTLQQKSPTSLKITFRQLHEQALADFEDSMRLELRITLRVLAAHDFYEGIRAAVIDKDRAPKWQPAEITAVRHKDIAAYFEGLDHELDL